MKKITKILLGGVLAVSLAFNVATIAAATYEKVEATIDYELKMQLNGLKFEPKENDGSLIRPLMYKGRTFLPVAALGNALDIPVSWDGATKTVIIGDSNPNAKIDLTTLKGTGGRKVAQYSWIIRNEDELRIDGDSGYQQFNSGIGGKIEYLWGCPADQVLVFPTENKDTLEFSAWSDLNCTLNVLTKEGECLEKISLKANQVTSRKISLKGVNTVSFAVENCNRDGNLKILDPIVYNK